MIKRTLAVSRLHTVAWPLLVAWPLGIVLVSFLICEAIFAAVGDTGNDVNFTGGVFALFGFAMVFYLQSMTQTFPFALGISVTRRDYFRATLLVAGIQTLIFGVILYLLALIEESTDGWGVKMRMFAIPRYFTNNPAIELFTYFAFLLLMNGLGLLLGALYQRWRQAGLFTLGLTALIGGGVIAWLATWQNWWGSIGSWFADVPRVVPLVLLPAAVAVAAMAGAWTVMRRATP